MLLIILDLVLALRPRLLSSLLLQPLPLLHLRLLLLQIRRVQEVIQFLALAVFLLFFNFTFVLSNMVLVHRIQFVEVRIVLHGVEAQNLARLPRLVRLLLHQIAYIVFLWVVGWIDYRIRKILETFSVLT